MGTHRARAAGLFRRRTGAAQALATCVLVAGLVLARAEHQAANAASQGPTGGGSAPLGAGEEPPPVGLAAAGSSFHVIWFVTALGKMRARAFESADSCERFTNDLGPSTPWQILVDGAERSRSRSPETLWPADWPTTWPAATLERTAALETLPLWKSLEQALARNVRRVAEGLGLPDGAPPSAPAAAAAAATPAGTHAGRGASGAAAGAAGSTSSAQGAAAAAPGLVQQEPEQEGAHFSAAETAANAQVPPSAALCVCMRAWSCRCACRLPCYSARAWEQNRMM
jgi:hypothetical protein